MKLEQIAFFAALKEEQLKMTFCVINADSLFIEIIETETDLSPSDATSDDPTFEVKVKSKEVVSD